MARNSGVLARQLLGNRNKLCAALLNHHHKLPPNSFHTLASISTTPSSSHTTPSNSKPFSKSVHHFSNPHFLQHRTLSSPSGPSKIVPIRTENEYYSAIDIVRDEALPALFYFTAVWCKTCRFISPVIGELSEQYPHVTTYKIDIDEKGLAYTLRNRNISSAPTFQFFQDGKKVAEIIGADVARLRDTFGKLYKLDEMQSHLKGGGRGDRVSENSSLKGETGREEHSDPNASSGVGASARHGRCAEECNFGSRRVAEGGEVDEEKMQQKLRERIEREKALRAKKAEEKLANGLANTSEEAEERALGKRPQDSDEGLSELDKRRRGLETAIHDVMGRTELPPFDLDSPPKLPLGLDELFPEGTEDTDFVVVRRQKKEVTLAMHPQEVPLVNAFLIGVKMDAGELAQMKATDFSDRVQKSVLSAANAFGDMYLTLARAEREVALARRHSEAAKAATAEAQAAIREKNALQLKVERLERELKEVYLRLEAAEEAKVDAKRNYSKWRVWVRDGKNPRGDGSPSGPRP